MKQGNKWKFWVDRGGTFTDVVYLPPGKSIQTVKLLSQSADYSDAVVEGIYRAMGSSFDPEQISEIRMGTTVATNAFLEGKGVSTGFVTTLGFVDLLQIRQQNRPQLFALEVKALPPVYDVATEVLERIDAHGEVLVPLNKEIARFELERLKSLGVQSLAIALMHATVNSEHELILAEIAHQVGFKYITLSHQVSSVPKLIPRGETTVVDAYLTPKLSAYTEKLADELNYNDLFFMQSHGGLCNKNEFKGHNALLSGPAGGYIGAVRSAQMQGIDKLITFDMGGTSTDVALFAGDLQLSLEPQFQGFNLQTPMLDIHTIAAGGGSILSFDGQRLRVGPESAGAFPGPACYRNGGPLTVTDANLFLKRIVPEKFPNIFGPNRDQPLDTNIVEQKFDKWSEELGIEPKALAQNFLDVAIESMVQAIRKVSVEKGLNPKDFTLCSFGGAGGQVAGQVAERLNIKKIFIHPHSSVLSAYGMGLAAEKHRETKAISKQISEVSDDYIRSEFKKLFRSVEKKFTEGKALNEAFYFQLKPSGSDHFVEVKAKSLGAAQKAFVKKYQQIFGIAPSDIIELQAITLELKKESPNLLPHQEFHQIKQIVGPGVISENNTSIVIDEGWRGNLYENGVWILEPTLIKKESPHRVEAAELEIFYQRFQAITEDMGHVLQNTGYSVNIKERLDYSCAMFSAKGELIANAPHMPVHLGSMSECVKVIDQKFRNTMVDGDCYITNAPTEGGTHLPDITLVSPVYCKGKVAFYVASRGHHADVGGIAPGSMPSNSRFLHEEGLVINSQKFVSSGEILATEMEKLFLKGDYPARNFAQNIHDLKAQLAANQRGISGLQDFIAQVGLDKVKFYGEKLLEYTHQRLQRALKDFKEGESCITLEGGRRVQVKITNQDKLVFDFEGTSDCDVANFNAPQPVVKAAILYCLRCLISENIPLNDGLARNLEVIIPKESLLSPRADSAVVAGNVETSQIICDAIFEALEKLAHSQGTMNNFSFGHGRHQYYETIAGGGGAGHGFNGSSGLQVHMTNSRLTDPEILESRFPIRVENFGLRRGSGGQGKFFGGEGIYRTICFLESMDCHLISQRRETEPRGLRGGMPGQSGVNSYFKNDGAVENFPSCFGVKVNIGETISIATPGGGGYGQPLIEAGQLIFAYGSNLDPLQMRQRCPSARVYGRALLKDHRMAFTRFSPHRMGGVADIKKSMGDEVWGLLYFLSEKDLERLDKIEGHPNDYKRVPLVVSLDNGKDVNCMTYDVVEKRPHVEPTTIYRWQIYKGAWRLNFPRKYLKTIISSGSILAGEQWSPQAE